MTDPSPSACSLRPGDLQRRLSEIAGLAADALIAHDADGDRHLLRFHASQETRQRLETIVEAESQCCPFLDLSLEERDESLTLSISSPPDAQPVAELLAGAFNTRNT